MMSRAIDEEEDDAWLHDDAFASSPIGPLQQRESSPELYGDQEGGSGAGASKKRELGYTYEEAEERYPPTPEEVSADGVDDAARACDVLHHSIEADVEDSNESKRKKRRRREKKRRAAAPVEQDRHDEDQESKSNVEAGDSDADEEAVILKSTKRRRSNSEDEVQQQGSEESIAQGRAEGLQRVGEACSLEELESFCKECLDWPELPKNDPTMAAQSKSYQRFFDNMSCYMDLVHAQEVPADLVRDIMDGVATHMRQADKALKASSESLALVAEMGEELMDAVREDRRKLDAAWWHKEPENVRNLDLEEDDEEED